MPFKKSRTFEEQEPEKDDELAPEVPTSFATKGVGWSGRDKEDEPDDRDLDDSK